MRRLFSAVVMLAALNFSATHAQSEPPCENRFRNPYVVPEICPEYVLENFARLSDAPYGMDSVRNLAFDAEGALYFTSPAHRAVFRMRPKGDHRFAAPEKFAELPQAPNGIAYSGEQDAFFVSADSMIWRINRDGEVVTLVDDLPKGAGGWLGQILIGSDRRLYVGKGSARGDGRDNDLRRGALLSFALDGSDMRIVAAGLRDPAAMVEVGNWLYVLDNERALYPAELNRLKRGKTVDFGFPQCNSLGQLVLPLADCSLTMGPILTFAPESTPSAMIYYDHPHFARLRADFQGSLIVALAGSWNAATISGYELIRVTFEDGVPTAHKFIPDYFGQSTSDAALLRASFYPYRVSGLTVSEEGWLYAAVADGYIYRFRLRSAPGQ